MLDSLDTPLGQLTLVAVVYAALVAAGALVVTLTRRPRPEILDHAVWILELLMAVRVVAGLGSMLGGRRPDEMSAHVGYLVAAVCVLPIAMQSVDDDRGPWSSGVIAVAALAVAVIGWRLAATWGHGG
jgi:threonine/homoserine efflux transporter RhtA